MPLFRSIHLAAAGLLAVAACGQPAEPPPALVGETDAFAVGWQRPVVADDSDLYFYYSASDGYTPVEGPEPGLYRVAIAGGAPSRLLAARALHGRRQGDDLILLLQGSDGTDVVTWPASGDAPSASVAVDPDSVSTASDGDYTYVLASDTSDNGRMAIVRLATDFEPDQTILERERAFVYDGALVPDGGYLYWMESFNQAMRIAADGSQTEPETLAELPRGFPVRGEWYDEWSRLIGAIDGQVYGLTYVESFFATGGSWDNGDPKGYNGFGGGAIYAVAAGASRTVAVDIRYAFIAGGVLYAQNSRGQLVTIDPQSGAQTVLTGRARPFDVFESMVANDELLFYADSDADYSEFAIRYVSLAATE